MADSRVLTSAVVEPIPAGTPGALRIEHFWLCMPVALLAWAVMMQTFGLVDFWWQLKTGEIIFTERRLIRADEFSFTVLGTPDTPYGWLSQLCMYLVYRVGGLELLVILNVALRVAALLPVYALAYEASGRRPRLTMFVVLLPAAMLAVYGTLRPQVFSFVFFTLFLWVLEGFLRRRRNLLWLLPILMVIWVNMHAAFVLGLVLIGLCLFGEGVRHLVLGPRTDVLSNRQLAQLAATLVACAVATLLNPDGPAIYLFVHAIQSSQTVQKLVTEWHPPSINRWEGAAIFYAPLFLVVTALLYGRRRPPFTQWLAFTCWAVFALTSLRNSIWFLLVTTPLLAEALANLELPELRALLRRIPVLSSFPGLLGNGASNRTANVPALNVLVLLILVGITFVLSPWIYPRLKPEKVFWEHKTPVGAMDYLERERLAGNIFHHQIFGDYLIWRLYPAQHTFIDGRTHLFPKEFVEDYLAVFSDPNWEERLTPYRIRLLLLCKHEWEEKLIRAARASPRWRWLYEDDVSVLFVRVDGPVESDMQ